MKRIIRCVVLGTGLAAVALAQTPPPDATQLSTVTLPPELARVLTDYEKAWRAHDVILRQPFPVSQTAPESRVGS